MERSNPSVTDSGLLEDFVRNGREESFNVLVQRYKVELFNVAFRVLYDRHSAEDVVQRVFIRLAERKSELTDVQSLRSWLYRTAVNLSLDMKKTMQRRREREKASAAFGNSETPREAAVKTEVRRELDLALASLKEPLRIPLVLRYLQGMSHAETAEIMNLSSDAIRMRVNRALKKLRKLIQRRGLLLSIVALEEGLRSVPAKAVPANFLASASSIVKAASTAGIAAKAAVTTTSLIKGGLIMTAKARIAIGVGVAILTGGTATYLATRHWHRAHRPPPTESHAASRQKRLSDKHRPDKPPIAKRTPRPEEEISGKVVDAQGNALAGVKVDAGFFQGESPESLTQKVFVRSTTTDSYGEFRFPERELFLRAKGLVVPRDAPSEGLPERLHLQSLLVASKEGYYPARRHVDFESATGPQMIVLKEAPQVNGRVVWKETREPIASLKVVCEPQNTDIYQSSRAECRTDGGGNFSLTISAGGTAKIWPEFANSYGRDPELRNIGLVPGERTTGVILAVELWSDTVIEGMVMDAEGRPVADARVQLATDRRVSVPTLSTDDGTYRLMVSRSWPYQSYFLKDWEEKPEMIVGMAGSFRSVGPTAENHRLLPGGYWDWAKLWSPPSNAPPERLVAFHPDYEIGVVEVPFLSVGQVRRGVDVILHRGSRISGRVVDDSSQPLEGANIEIKVDPDDSAVLIKHDEEIIRWEKKTAAGDGGFEIHCLPEGSYELTASHDDCDPATKRLQLGPHQVVEGFDFVLVKRTGFIRGRVLDQLGNPWPHGKVRTAIGYIFRGRTYVADIKEDGSYELSHMKSGKYDLWLDVSADYPQPEGILWATPLRGIPTGTEGADITVMEFPAGALRLRVVDQEQQPIEEFHLHCCPLSLTDGKSGIVTGPLKEEKGNRTYDCYTRDRKYSGLLHFKRDIVSESGEFLAERVAPGSYFVSVRAERRAERFAEVEIRAGQETQMTFELQDLCRLRGIVVDSRDLPIEAVKVTAIKLRDVLFPSARVGSSSVRTKSGADGRFELENLEQTDYRVAAEDEQGRTVFADVTVGQNGRDFVELVFRRGSSLIEGYVCGEDGALLSEVVVALEGNGQKLSTRTDGQGRYAFSDLLPGNYLVKAWTGPSGRWGRGLYRGQQVQLRGGQHAAVDIIAWGDGQVEGKISLTGDAARAGSGESSRRLLLRELTHSGVSGGKEIALPGRDSFLFKNIPAGTYQAQAYFVVRINPEPIPVITESAYAARGCRAVFVSEPEIVRVSPGSTAAIHLTISQATAPYYPIPDPATCERLAPVAP